jgi:uncharacterized protein YggT (Ycf19 family)
MAEKDNVIKVPAYLTVGKIITWAMYIWVLFGIIVLGLRVFLLAFSANESTPFVKFIINTSQTFLNPFRGIFQPKPIGQTGYLDVAAIFAMIIYALIGWGFSALVKYIQVKINEYADAEKQRQKEERQPQYSYKKTTVSERQSRTV